MHALIDGDIIVFTSGFAAERKEWHLTVPSQEYAGVFEYKREAMDKLDVLLPGVYSRKEGDDYRLFAEINLEPLSHALQNVKRTVAKALEAVDCTDFDVKMFLSGKDNFRKEVAVTRPYKGNRDRTHRPTYELEIREFIKSTWDTTEAEGEEADDLLGIAQTKYGPHDSVIISIDKDLDQIPGLKYNTKHDIRYDVTEQEAIYNFYTQLLMGDSTDNIPGLPGIGAGKAKKALHGMETEQEMIEECVRMYQIHSGKDDWQTYMIEQGRLLWIRREVGEMWDLPQIEEHMTLENELQVDLYGDPV
jgi:hypothetical protein